MNIIKSLGLLRLLDGVVQYYTFRDRLWRYFTNSVETRTSGFNLAISDINKYIRIKSSANQIVTISSLPFPVGSSIVIEKAGTGNITIVSLSDTLNGATSVINQYGCI